MNTNLKLKTQLHFIFSLLLLAGVEFILSAALYMEFFHHEIPCPLCLLQRVLFLGICFCLLLNLRCQFSIRHEGLLMFTTILLLIISTRQTLLDIYPRPGHEYIGTAIFDLHMPVWSIVISILLLIAYAFRFLILGYDDGFKLVKTASPASHSITLLLTGFAIIIGLINLVSVFLQCGFESCHTFGYRLLS